MAKPQRSFGWAYAAIAILLFAGGGTLGFYMARNSLKGSLDAPDTNSSSLRQKGFEFINPLLACNVNPPKGFLEDKKLESEISSYIDSEVQNGNVSRAGVYFYNFTTGDWTNVNDDILFYPASLSKVPLMIAYYKLAETDPSILSKKLTYSNPADSNTQQEVPVADPLVRGQKYTVNQLIEHMVEHSDNNATELLFNNIDQDALKEVFSDLETPYFPETSTPTDFIDPKDFSLFLRVLYNSTYLSRTYSEEALSLLSKSSFKEGLAAGIPQNVTVAHKFGLLSLAPDNQNVTFREMHDCGIVYHPKGAYLICIMTKSNAPLVTLESTIAHISKIVYDDQ